MPSSYASTIIALLIVDCVRKNEIALYSGEAKQFCKASILYSCVFLVSLPKPNIILIPGRKLGIPLSPLSEPYLFKISIAFIAICGEQFNLFAFTTFGSKLSIPNAAIFPGVQYFTIAFVISSFLITDTGFTLSMCNTSISGHSFLIFFSKFFFIKRAAVTSACLFTCLAVIKE